MRVLTVIGNRPQFVKAAAVSRLLRERARGAARPHRPALRRRAVDGLLRGARRAARPSASSDIDGGTNTDADRAHARGARAAAGRRARPTRCSSTATRTRRSPARSPPRRRGVPVAHVEAGHALVRPRDARGAQPRPDRPRRPTCCCARRRRRSTTSRASASPARVELVGDVMVDVAQLFQPRARERRRRAAARRRRRARRLRARHRAPRRQRRRPRAPAPARRPAARAAAAGRACRCTRARARGWTPPGWLDELAGRAHVRLTPPLGYLDVHRAAAQRARDAHRLRRRAEGGLPGGRAVRDAARHDRVGRDGRRAAGTCSSTSTRDAALAALERTPPAERPQLYGDGRAGERVVAALERGDLTARPMRRSATPAAANGAGSSDAAAVDDRADAGQVRRRRARVLAWSACTIAASTGVAVPRRRSRARAAPRRRRAGRGDDGCAPRRASASRSGERAARTRSP